MSSRTITSACLNVYTRSGVTAADQHPSAASAHSKQEDWQPQVDRLRLERELSEKNSRRLEECNAELRRAADEAEARMREAMEEKEALQAAVDRLKKNVRLYTIWETVLRS